MEQETQKPSNWTDGSSLNRNELEKGRHLFYRSNITERPSVRCWTLDQKQKTPWRFSDCSNHRPQSQLHIYPICTLLLCHMYLQINFWLPPSVASDCRLNWQANIQLQQHLTASFSNLTSEIGITCASCFDLFPSYSFLLFHPFLNNISTNIFICWLCNTCAIQLLECAIPRPLVAKQPDFRCHFIFLTKKIRENAAIRNPLVAKRPDFWCHFIFSQKKGWWCSEIKTLCGNHPLALGMNLL